MTKMQLPFTLSLTDILHVFIKKCKSKPLKRKQSHNSHSYTFRKERTPTSNNLCLSDFSGNIRFLLREHQTLLSSIVLHYFLGNSHCVHKKIFIWCWLMNSVTLASSWLMSMLSYLSSFLHFYFLVGQGFEFWALCMQSRFSTTWATLPVFFAVIIFGGWSSWNICTSPKTLKYKNNWILEKRNE
jgi:hypothetical protein